MPEYGILTSLGFEVRNFSYLERTRPPPSPLNFFKSKVGSRATNYYDLGDKLTLMEDPEDSVAFHHTDFSFEDVRAACELIPLPPITPTRDEDRGLVTTDSNGPDYMTTARSEPAAEASDTDSRASCVSASHALKFMQHWDDFFAKHKKGAFFKARRYIVKEFESYLSAATVVLEVGSGYGCTMLPIIKTFPSIHYIATDYSPHAIDILKSTNLIEPSRVSAEVLDIIISPYATDHSPICSLPQCCLAIFVLSAIETKYHGIAVANMAASLAPGGCVLFRDYGLFDMTMFRHKTRLEERLFQRSDKTLSYYFDLDYVDHLFSGVCGLEKLELRYDCVTCTNRRSGQTMNRIFVHAVYRKSVNIL